MIFDRPFGFRIPRELLQNSEPESNQHIKRRIFIGALAEQKQRVGRKWNIDCKKRVFEMNGTIEFESGTGKATTLSLC